MYLAKGGHMKKFIRSLKESKVSNFELIRILFIYSCIIAAFNIFNGYLHRKESRRQHEKVLSHKCNTANSVLYEKNH